MDFSFYNFISYLYFNKIGIRTQNLLLSDNNVTQQFFGLFLAVIADNRRMSWNESLEYTRDNKNNGRK